MNDTQKKQVISIVTSCGFIDFHLIRSRLGLSKEAVERSLQKDKNFRKILEAILDVREGRISS